MASTVVIIKHTDKLPPMKTGAHKVNLRTLTNFLVAIVAGIKQAKFVDIHPNASADPVAASGTVTCASAANADTVTVNGVVFTATTGTPTGNQFKVGVSDTADAASLVAGINASVTALVSGYVTASNVAGLVTITALRKGVDGNAFTLASSNGTRLAVSGARLTGGTGGNVAATTVSL